MIDQRGEESGSAAASRNNKTSVRNKTYISSSTESKTTSLPNFPDITFESSEKSFLRAKVIDFTHQVQFSTILYQVLYENSCKFVLKT